MIDEPWVNELKFASVLHALGDPTRLAVVAQIAAGERLCGALRVEVAKSTLYQHLQVLRKAGVTHTRRLGNGWWVSLRRADLDTRFPGLLDAVMPPAYPQSVRAPAVGHWPHPTPRNRDSSRNSAGPLLSTGSWSDW
jgi:DNA-binding transcriptional ArsR family regulator